MYIWIIAKNLKGPLCCLPAALLLVVGTASGQVRPAGVLDRPMPEALRAASQSPVYAAHDVLLTARVAGGIMYLGDDGPARDVVIPGGVTVGEALTRMLSPQDRYIWRVTDGVIDVVPRAGTPPLLDTIIPYYEWRSNEIPFFSVGRLAQLPEVVRRMSELGLVDGLHVVVMSFKAPRVYGPTEPPEIPQVFVRRNITLLKLLNEIVKSYPPPAIWWYRELPQGKARGVTIEAR